MGIRTAEDCAPDCGERAACDKSDQGGHMFCGACWCGEPRHHCSSRHDPMPADLPDRTLARMAEDEPCSSVTCGATGDDLDDDGRCSRCPRGYEA